MALKASKVQAHCHMHIQIKKYRHHKYELSTSHTPNGISQKNKKENKRCETPTLECDIVPNVTKREISTKEGVDAT